MAGSAVRVYLPENRQIVVEGVNLVRVSQIVGDLSRIENALICHSGNGENSPVIAQFRIDQIVGYSLE